MVRSNIWLLTKMGARVVVCAPPTLLPPRIEEMGVEATTDFDAALDGADVVMMLRMQLERQGTSSFPSSREYFKRYGLTAARLARAEAGRGGDAPRADEPRRRDLLGDRGLDAVARSSSRSPTESRSGWRCSTSS